VEAMQMVGFPQLCWFVAGIGELMCVFCLFCLMVLFGGFL